MITQPEAQRSVEVLADELRRLADQLVFVSQQFVTLQHTAAVTADVVSECIECIQGIGGHTRNSDVDHVSKNSRRVGGLR